MRWRGTVWTGLIAFLLAAGLGACGGGGNVSEENDGDAESVNIPELVAEGKDYLSQGDYYHAETRFNAVLVKDPQNTEANYGLCLVSMQETIYQVSLVFGLADPTTDSDTPDGDADSAETAIATRRAINDVADSLAQMQVEQLARLDLLKAKGTAAMDLPHFPIIINHHTLADLHSHWDDADLYVLSAACAVSSCSPAPRKSANWSRSSISSATSCIVASKAPASGPSCSPAARPPSPYVREAPTNGS